MCSARSLVAAPVAVGCSLFALAFAGPPTADAAIPPYTLVGSFPLAADAWDILPDGRVITLKGLTLSAQTLPNSGTFAPIGSLAAATVSSFGASFLRVSPDGSRLAIGDNNFGSGARVHFVSSAALNTSAASPTTSVLLGNYDAVWSGPAELLVTGFGSSSQLARVDADALTTRTLITNIGDGSGGVALLGSQVFTAIGFDAGGITTGRIRSFDLPSLIAAVTPANFATGSPVATILSGASLGFDRFGNLLGGGADYSNFPATIGYASVIDFASPGQPRLDLFPAGADRPYSVRFDSATDELLVVAGGTAYRYAVPTPAAAMPLALAGLVAHRRRRHA